MEEFIFYQQAQCIPWPENVVTYESCVSEMGSAIEKFSFFCESLPARVFVFLTTGKEEARLERGIAYCRGKNAIFIGRANLEDWAKNSVAMKKLMLHELWHIFSRNVGHHVQDSMYGVFGFKRIPRKLTKNQKKKIKKKNKKKQQQQQEGGGGGVNNIVTVDDHSFTGIMYPDEISPLRFTNPDAIFVSHYIEVGAPEGQEGSLPLVPLVFLNPYDVHQDNETPFDHLTVAFGVLDLDTLQWATEPAETEEEGGQGGGQDDVDEVTLLMPPGALPDDFWRQVSRNTTYILHVEEVCAENFVMAALKDEECDNINKVRALEELLKTGPQKQ